MVSEIQKQQILKRKQSLKQKAANKAGKKVIVKKTKTNPNNNLTNAVEINASELNWKPVEIPDTLDDFEGFYGLEEIDNVDVQIIDGAVKFLSKNANNKITKEEAAQKEKAIPAGKFELDPEDVKESEIEAAQSDISDEEMLDEEEEQVTEPTAEVEVTKTEEPVVKSVQSKREGDENLSDDDDSESDEETEKKKKNRRTEKVTTLIASKDENDEIDVPKLPGIQKKKESKPEVAKKVNKSTEDDLKSNTFAMLSDAPEPTEDAELPEWSELSLSGTTLNGLNSLGFKTPTEIQKRTIPVSIEGKDIIGKAITGSGKTLAYGIPILEKALSEIENNKRLPEKFQKHPTAIIFTPTRELANQVMKHLSELFKYSTFSDKTVMSLTGGLSIQKQERLLSYGPKVLVATPGRCLELLEKSTELAEQLAAIDMLVLDEADRMLQDGQFDEMKKIFEILQNYRPKEIPYFGKRWQSLIFSATFSKDLFGKLASQKPNPNKRKHNDDEDSEIKEVLEILGKKLRFRGKPEFIDVNPTDVVASRIVEAMIPCSTMERDLMLYYFISIFPGTTLVFTNSIDSVKRLAPTLNNLGIPTVSIHSSMVQKQRLRAIERFKRNCDTARKEKKSSVLIASDVAARGLDINNIQHVVHYHLPRTADSYVHRSGRTARAGNEGVSIVLCSPQEASGPLRKLRSVLTKKSKVEDLKTIDIDSDILEQLKGRLDLAAKIAQAEVASQSVQKEKSWIDKAAEELGVEDIDDFEDDFLKRDRKRREGKALDSRNVKIMRAQLREALKKQVRKSGRRSYIAGGINNIAELLLNNSGTNNVIGYLQKDALEELKNKKKTKKVKI